MKRIKPGRRTVLLVFLCPCVFVPLCLCVFIVTGCAKREAKNIDAKGTAIVCFGDSITFGYGAQPGEDYPAALAQMVKAPVLNMGIDGDTTIEAIKRVDSDVLDRDPFLVIIEFGGNDFLRRIPLEDTVSNLKEMIRRVHAHGAMVVLVDISAGMFLQDYRAAYKKLASQEQAVFVSSVLSGIVTNPRLKSDFLHPNKDGYQMIAKRIIQEIAPYLQERNLLKNSSKINH